MLKANHCCVLVSGYFCHSYHQERADNQQQLPGLMLSQGNRWPPISPGAQGFKRLYLQKLNTLLFTCKQKVRWGLQAFRVGSPQLHTYTR